MNFNYLHIKAMLVEKNISIKQFAKKLNIKYSTARSFLNGSRIPKTKYYERIMKITDINNINELFSVSK